MSTNENGGTAYCHPREKVVRKASIEARVAVDEILRKHGITDGEETRVILAIVNDFIGGMARHMIRMERHGNADEPGGLAGEDEE